MLSEEVDKTNFIVQIFALALPGLEPTIYGTQGEHTNHYATDAVFSSYMHWHTGLSLTILCLMI